MRIILPVLITILFTGAFACSSTELRTGSPAANTITPVSNSGSSTAEVAKQAIRNVDFANFTYPWLPELVDPQNPKKDLTMRSGELKPVFDDENAVIEMGASLESIAYGDVTGDGHEDALIVLGIRTGAQITPRVLYVYGTESYGPGLLWAISFGDRENGGLRKVYANDGDLVIEQYSPKDSKGACCPIYFDRLSYEWEAGKFRERRRVERLPNTEGHSSPLMPRFVARP